MYLVLHVFTQFCQKLVHTGDICNSNFHFMLGQFIRGGLIPPDFAGQTNTWYHLLRVSKICRSISYFFDYLLFPV